MVKFLIASHGFLADGFKSSINVLMGEDIANSIETINAFVENGDKNPKGRIEEIINGLSEDDDLVVFTDLMYGSVNQFVIPFNSKSNLFVISGTNFPVICEVISKLTFGYEQKRPSEEELNDIVEKARQQLIYIQNIDNDSNDNDDEFFE